MARILPLAVGPTIWRIRYPFPGQGWEIQRQGQLFFLHLSVPASEVITTPAVKQDPVFFFLFSFHRDSLCCSVTLAIRFARTRNRDHSDQKVPQVCTVISRGGVRDTRALVSSYPSPPRGIKQHSWGGAASTPSLRCFGNLWCYCGQNCWTEPGAGL